MFEQCCAVVVTASPERDRLFRQLARDLEFGEIVVAADDGLDRLLPPIIYFLVDHELDDSDLREAIDVVRAHPSDGLRFAPIVLFVPELSAEAERRYFPFGFDDVVGFNEGRDGLRLRLAAHLDAHKVYFETNGYLGPDRRRREGLLDARGGFSPFTRIIFRRDVERGIRIVSRYDRGERFRTRAWPVESVVPRLLGQAPH